MKVSDLRKNKKKELEKMIEDKRKKLQDVRFRLSSGRVKNVKEARDLRKDIAKILTILKEGSYEK